MYKILSNFIYLGFLISIFFVSGCTQLPTEKQKISDMRPQVSFKADNSYASDARVIIDGLDMGIVSEFIEDKASIRILSGTHTIKVTSGSDVLLEEKIYLGDGVNRSFIVKSGK